MSDTVRSYTTEAGSLQRRRRGRRGGWWRVLLVILIVGTCWAFWITRDSYSVRQFVAAKQAYHVVLSDPAQNRSRIASSPIWEALPASLGLTPLRTMVTETMGYPEWVFNNFVRERLHATGPDLTQFDDTVFVTRMSRMGRLLEPLGVWLPSIERDYAGGLALRKVIDPGFFYAVRGRVLIMSRSRDALIRSLTLDTDRVIAEDEYSTLTQTGDEDLRGFILLPEHEPGDSLLAHVGFALRIDGNGLHAKFQTRYSDYWKQRLRPMMLDLKPQTLRMPVDGPAMLSMDFRKPFKEVWTGIGEAFHVDLMSQERWEGWSERPLFEAPGLPFMATGVLANCGPGIRISLQGVDTREIVPMPELVLTLDAKRSELQKAFESIPAPPATLHPWDSYPRYDSATQTVSVPMWGGPSIEPTAKVLGDQLMISSSRPVAQRIISQELDSGTLEQEGNLYFRIVPEKCADALIESARQFAAVGALKGVTKGEFETLTQEWRSASSRVSEITLLAVLNETGAAMELRIVCPSVSTQQP
ncbi:MAG: hypothetical protein AMXMBFR84_45790 [Candidatus Hydrogenedentota bacterium]